MENQQPVVNVRETTKPQKAPIFLTVIFKIFGGLLVIPLTFSAVFAISMAVGSGSIPLFSSSMLALYGLVINSFIIGIGLWEIKRWVIPILGICTINAVINFIVGGFYLNLNSINYLLFIVIFVLAIVYRRYFTGSFKTWIVYVIFVLGVALTYASLVAPLWGGISNADIDAYIDSQEFNIYFKEALKEQMGDAADSFTDEDLNELKAKVRDDAGFRNQIKIILEIEKK